MDQFNQAKDDVTVAVDSKDGDDCCQTWKVLFLLLGPMVLMSMADGTRGNLNKLARVERVRTEFPETWIWSIVKTGYTDI